ncbi:MAG: ABC transporter ATP-binding protein [Candidimonas sp.]|nr:MAG: ABC transporter ATP-binding protein [Candidimonas sp.]TAM21701.1 MAG: ABC transporter ATP-binding protein [Candidimonas sp.]TAM77651.1 MAG: ABC transporter ATP-binding protein [Candidimonas sp.]
MSTVSVNAVGKMYPSYKTSDPSTIALDNVSFEVKNHEFCSILGHSGCGKTSLLNIVAGFEAATSGEILVDGQQVDKPTWKRAMIFQDYALFPWLTVEKNIAFGLEMKKISPEERKIIIESNIQLVGLMGFEKSYPHQLSGGMKQRVSIARALAVDPNVLLMDEPFAALDAQNRTLMQQEMGRLLAASGPSQRRTMMLVTHSIEESILLSDRIIVLTTRPGRVKANIEVALPRPRDEDDPQFRELKIRLRGLLHEELQ